MEVPGVLDASVGYTGREFNDLDLVEGEDEDDSQPPKYHQPTATYRSVCGGDGHTEAVRLIFDPTIIPYREIARQFFENPRVPVIHGKQDPQYQVACWAMDDQQRDLAKAAAEAAGKGGVPVYDARCTMWHEGEENHQNFFGSKPSRGKPGILFDPLSL
jgi:peptide-methionine (S)-S-oxide reductase